MTSSAPRPTVHPWWDWGCWLLGLLAFGGLAVWALDAHIASWWGPERNGYYGLLTDAFHRGQLHLAIDVDPRLLALENPYAGPQGALRPHDMSFYDGKFYLYYGAAPVILLYWPWLLLTGTHLSEVVGALAFLVVGFAAGTLWLTRVKRTFFPALSPVWLAVGIAALGSSLPLLESLANNTFYGVPIHAGFACLMLAILCLDVALRQDTWRSRALWLAVTSTWWGFAVASRPIHLLSLTLLGLAALWLASRERGQPDYFRRARILLTSAIAPAALIGVALMLYNFLRFDDPFDFGIRFSLATADLRDAHLVGPEFLAHNFWTYLLRPGDYLRYFPFFLTSDWPVGMLRYLPLIWLAPLFPLIALSLSRFSALWLASVGAALAAGGATLTMLCLFFGSQPRYLVDFAPPALLAALATSMGLIAMASKRPVSAKVARAIVAVLALWGGIHGSLAGLALFPQVPFRESVARVLHHPVAWIESLTGTTHGSLELKVRFPSGQTGRTEPLLATGGIFGNGDITTVTYLDEGHVQFGTFKSGAGGSRSISIPINYSAVHTVEIFTGGLLPPVTHPYFRDLSTAEREALRRQIVIKLNGQTVLRAAQTPYPASPPLQRIGLNPIAIDVSDPAFKGEILGQRRLTNDFANLDLRGSVEGPVKMLLTLHAQPHSPGAPLIASGRHGAGDLIVAEVLPGDQVRFGHDSWGGGMTWTEAVPLPATNPFDLYVEYGALVAPATPTSTPSSSHRFVVAINDEPLINVERPFHPSAAAEIEFGYNTIGASGGVANFAGTIHEVRRVQPISVDNWDQPWGPVRLAVKFPLGRTGEREPLLTTGEAGRADILYVEYGEGAVRFGHDHWGIGAAVGPWLKVDFTAIHRLEFDLASLYPPSDDPAWATRPDATPPPSPIIHLNRAEALRSHLSTHPATSSSATIGRNDLGASSCAVAFAGQIFIRRREAW